MAASASVACNIQNSGVFDNVFCFLETLRTTVQQSILGIGSTLAAQPLLLELIGLGFGVLVLVMIMDLMFDGDLVEFLAKFLRSAFIGLISVYVLSNWSSFSQVPLGVISWAENTLLTSQYLGTSGNGGAVNMLGGAAQQIYAAYTRDFGEPGQQASSGSGSSGSGSGSSGSSSNLPWYDIGGQFGIDFITFLSELLAQILGYIGIGFAILGLFIGFIISRVALIGAWMAIAFMPIGVATLVFDKGRMLGSAISLFLTQLGHYVITCLLLYSTASGYATAVQQMVAMGAQSGNGTVGTSNGAGMTEILVAIFSIAYALFMIAVVKHGTTLAQGLFGSVGIGFDPIGYRGYGFPKLPPRKDETKPSPTPAPRGGGSGGGVPLVSGPRGGGGGGGGVPLISGPRGGGGGGGNVFDAKLGSDGVYRVD